MTLAIWRQPELVRHVRAKLRRPRVVGLAVTALVVHALVAVTAATNLGSGSGDFFRSAYFASLAVESATFLLWCALSCGRAVSAERQARTWDFLRLTRMGPLELAFGKLFGEPIGAYFFLACSVPFGAAAGILAGFGAAAVAGTYALLVLLGVFVGLVALFASMFLERGAGGAAAMIVLLQAQSLSALAETRPLSGFASLSVVPAVLELHGLGFETRPTLFGLPVPWALATVVLLAVFGAILSLAIRRNLKRDLDRMVPWSRGQVLAIVAVANVLFWALVDPAAVGTALGPTDLAGAAVAWNAALFLLSAIALVAPRDAIRGWSRRYVASQERYFSESGPPWPWLVLAAGLGYVAFVVGAFAFRGRAPLAEWPFGATAVDLFAVAAFGIRDLLFFQWCRLTRLRAPLTTGVLLVCLVHGAIAVIAAAAWWRSPEAFAAILALTPAPALHAAATGQPPSPAVAIGAALQLVPSALLLRAISTRVKRPPKPGA